MRTYGLGAIVALLLTFFGNLALMGILCLILALPIMQLWNWLVPSIFGLPALTYWQAWALDMLVALMFNSRASINKKEEREE